MAGRCPNCSSICFPPEGACSDCRERVSFEPIQLPLSGRIATITVIGQGGAPPEFAEQQRQDGPFAVAVVEIAIEDDSVRLPGQIVDCNPDDLSIDDTVVGTFRRIYSTEGVTRYGLKFKPTRGTSDDR